MLKVVFKEKVAIIRSDSGKKVYSKKDHKSYSVVEIEITKYHENDYSELD